MKTFEMHIQGSFLMAEFFDFCRHRATRLDLPGTFTEVSSHEVQILVNGEEDLVDMFEVACWLGPRSAYVEAISTRNYPQPNAPQSGFRRIR